MKTLLLASLACPLALLFHASPDAPALQRLHIPLLLPPSFPAVSARLEVADAQGGRAQLHGRKLAPDLWVFSGELAETARDYTLTLDWQRARESGKVEHKGTLEVAAQPHPRGNPPVPRSKPIDLSRSADLQRVQGAVEHVTYVFKEPKELAGKVRFVESFTHWLSGSGPGGEVMVPVGDGRWIGNGACMPGATDLHAAFRLQLDDGRCVNGKGAPAETTEFPELPNWVEGKAGSSPVTVVHRQAN